MPAFFEYLRNITYYLMFATVVGIFAPAGRYRKFVSLVLGFILLLLMIQPLAGFFRGTEIPVTEWFLGALPEFGGSGESEAAYIRWRDGYLRGAFETQLEHQLARLLTDNGFVVYSAEFEYSDDFSRITSVRVSLSRAEETTGRVPFIRIQPPQMPQIDTIRIGIGDSGPLGQFGQIETEVPDCPTATAAKTLISEFYNLPKSHIYVNVR